MASKISELAAVAVPADTDEFAVNQGGTSKKVTRAQIRDGLAASSHTHTLSEIDDAGALAALDQVDTAQIVAAAVGPTELEDTTVTPGTYTNATITVDQQGRLTEASSGAGGGDSLTLAFESGAAVTVGADTDGEYNLLTSGDATTLTLDAQATVGMRSAFQPAGAGAVSVEVESGAGYWLPQDNIGGAARTTTFALKGYGYLECIRNTGGSAAEWVFIGDSDHAKSAFGAVTFNDDLDMSGNAVFGNVVDLATVSGALDDTHIGKRLTTNGSITIPTTPTGWWAEIVLGADTHDISFNSVTLDVSAAGWAAGDELHAVVTGATTIKIKRTAAADITDQTSFA